MELCIHVVAPKVSASLYIKGYGLSPPPQCVQVSGKVSNDCRDAAGAIDERRARSAVHRKGASAMPLGGVPRRGATAARGFGHHHFKQGSTRAVTASRYGELGASTPKRGSDVPETWLGESHRTGCHLAPRPAQATARLLGVFRPRPPFTITFPTVAFRAL
jgi:hypothetical protein